MNEQNDKGTMTCEKTVESSPKSKRMIGDFTRTSKRQGAPAEIAIDFRRVVCLTLSKFTGETVIQSYDEDTKKKRNLLVAENFNEALKIWRAHEEVSVFHVPSLDGARSLPCAVATAGIKSVEIYDRAGTACVVTRTGTYDITDKFADAVRIWAA